MIKKAIQYFDTYALSKRRSHKVCVRIIDAGHGILNLIWKNGLEYLGKLILISDICQWIF